MEFSSDFGLLLQFGYVLNLFAYQLFSQTVSNLLEATFLTHLTDCDVDPPQVSQDAELRE